jgi:hypothetical protein
MRKLPTALAVLFLAVQINRVASFSATLGAGIIFAWIFSIALALGVFATAYWTRESITIKEGKNEDRRAANVRKNASLWLIVFVVADGLFNLADVLNHVPPGSGNTTVIAAWIYGLFPTVATAGLGKLQGLVDRLPVPPGGKKGIADVVRELVIELIGDNSHEAKDAPATKDGDAQSEPQVAADAEPKTAPAPQKEYRCDECGEVMYSASAKAHHVRWKKCKQ